MAELQNFIAFEGSEGVGKSTVIRLVAEQLEILGHRCLVTEEPTFPGESGSPIAERIQRILEKKDPAPAMLAFQELFVLDRHYHVNHVVVPKLREGFVVLTDRYWLSTLAYGMLDGPVEQYIALHAKVFGKQFLLPRTTLLLDLPAEAAFERVKTRKIGRSFFEETEKMERIRQNYLELAGMNLAQTFVIDASVAPDEVANQICSQLAPRLKGRK